ncbi:LCP family protein [Leifsonia sp. H3M29-4]|uniref:LCP family protein n=1 Tax=Salinibacterium metalliresistens TaxID=3031321 RepID=UPI0023DAC63F|nr:LCP family protein [Salinibacterium metalliresistens]MDF1479139.1 LCP family protein [Salinibacterium metalliresistens]
MSATNPVRYPDTNAPALMTKRAWWLVVLNVLIPGSAQLLAGNRRLGRFGVASTFVLWGLAIIAVLLYFLNRTILLTVLSTTIGLWAVTALLLFYAVLWVVLTLDTLRLVRFVRVPPRGRAAVAGVAILALVVAGGGASYGAYLATTANTFITDVFVTAPPEPPVDGRYNILLLGGDAGPDRDGLRPDSITVVSVDAETGAATMIGLPRNLEYFPFVEGSPLAAEYPNGYGWDGCEVDVCLLNSVYTEVELISPEMYPDAAAQGSQPGIEGMRDAVEGITGLTIQYYALIDMQGFSDLINALGGVTINVETAVPVHTDETFSEVAYYIGPGVVQMDGYTALWYARSRHDTTDYDRMARQRQLQQAILEQFNPANVLAKFQSIAQASSQVVRTDIPQATLGYFVELASKTRELPITDVELVPANGVEPEDPDYAYIRELVAAAVAPAAEDEPTG